MTQPASRQKYRTIANQIHAAIGKGLIQTGERIPSEREISERWEVSRPTAAKALNELHHRGLIVRRPGKGNFVQAAGPPVVDRDRVLVEAERLVRDNELTPAGFLRLMNAIDR